MRRLLPISLLLLACLGSPDPSRAIDWLVDTAKDGADENPEDANCDGDPKTAGSQCTLRAAVQSANTSPGPDTIFVPAGRYRLTVPGGPGDPVGGDAAEGDLDVGPGGLVIRGAGASQTIIDGRRRQRVFEVEGGLDLVEIALTRGSLGKHFGGLDGGCIRADLDAGRLLLERVIMSGCRSDPGSGGAIFAGNGQVRIVDSALLRNRASSGAALFLAGVAGEIERSLIANNVAEDSGGGLLSISGTIAITNSTISGNRALIAGGAIQHGHDGHLTLRHATIVGNLLGRGLRWRPPEGAAIHVFSGGVTVTNSILASKRGENCSISSFATMTSGGANIDSGTSCGLSQPSDRSGVDPLVEKLADNGGPTRSHALDAASPARDLVASGCATEDQRGGVRGEPCDAGALEMP